MPMVTTRQTCRGLHSMRQAWFDAEEYQGIYWAENTILDQTHAEPERNLGCPGREGKRASPGEGSGKSPRTDWNIDSVEEGAGRARKRRPVTPGEELVQGGMQLR